jgi:DNA replicative helicase MCM subunit Mcm2 (Cdc46/Mcm family)
MCTSVDTSQTHSLTHSLPACNCFHPRLLTRTRPHSPTQHDVALYKQLLRYPAETINIFDLVLSEYVNINDLDIKFIQVRTFNLEASTAMRELNPDDIDQLVALKGMVRLISSSLISITCHVSA